ncbi:MAG: helix-hairpin-helix domain-containing protein [Candidatus Cloacimonetes bacterium]|nr:helix-hairpin-helix domain-containing protein [Candidatus Cloacimonadota bacterium]
MRRLIILLLIFLTALTNLPALLDLNTASLEEIKSLPISESQARDIYLYRYYIKFFESIYELRQIPSIDQKTLNLLKPLIIVSHYQDEDEIAQRRDEIYYLIERLGSNEGFQEGISDVWEDYLITPRNINKLTYFEILNLPNVSPVDAAAILSRLAYGDSIANYRDLRNSPGISYYGASNMRYYVNYENEPLIRKFSINYQLKYSDAPYDPDAVDMFSESMIRLVQVDEDVDPATPTAKRQSYWGYFNMEDHKETVANKIRMNYLNNWKAGLLFNSSKGERTIFKSNVENWWDDAKYYLGYERDINFQGRNHLKIYLGNYRATFGEGLIMENTDYYSPRKTGFGFNKRIIGITEDLSRTREFSLKGFALDWKRDNFNAAFFASFDKKDAVVYDSNDNGIIDEDDDLLCYINLTHRFANRELEEIEDYINSYENNLNQVKIAPRLDAVQENILGAHLEYHPFVGTHLGITGYEAVYDRDFVVPQEGELRHLLITEDEDAAEKWKISDNEIESLYSTRSSVVGDRDFRRVYGFDWGTVWNNTSFQGEYAELEVDGDILKIADDPHAFLLTAYTQFENLYLLSLYRDYDLDFDNPYARGFSESERFDDTVFERLTYALNNTLLTDIYLNAAQPSAERGIYFETRYRFHEMFTITRAYLDIWERKSDARKGIRFESRFEFRPIHQVRFRFRYKYQLKRYQDDLDRNRSQTDEFEPAFVFYLSNFDRLQLGYVYTRVKQPPYLSILSDPAEPDPTGEELGMDMAQANTLSNGDMIYVDFTHNFNDNFKILGSFSIWKTHGASLWDFEDVELDFYQSDRGFKYWFNLHTRIANNIFLSLKYKFKRFMTREYEFRIFNEIPSAGPYYYERVQREETSIRLQLDCKF